MNAPIYISYISSYISEKFIYEPMTTIYRVSREKKKKKSADR